MEKLMKKFSKKGWSESKIARALELNKSESLPKAGLRPDVVNLLNELIGSFGEVRGSLRRGQVTDPVGEFFPTSSMNRS